MCEYVCKYLAIHRWCQAHRWAAQHWWASKHDLVGLGGSGPANWLDYKYCTLQRKICLIFISKAAQETKNPHFIVRVIDSFMCMQLYQFKWLLAPVVPLKLLKSCNSVSSTTFQPSEMLYMFFYSWCFTCVVLRFLHPLQSSFVPLTFAHFSLFISCPVEQHKQHDEHVQRDR